MIWLTVWVIGRLSWMMSRRSWTSAGIGVALGDLERDAAEAEALGVAELAVAAVGLRVVPRVGDRLQPLDLEDRGGHGRAQDVDRAAELDVGDHVGAADAEPAAVAVGEGLAGARGDAG